MLGTFSLVKAKFIKRESFNCYRSLKDLVGADEDEAIVHQVVLLLLMVYLIEVMEIEQEGR